MNGRNGLAVAAVGAAGLFAGTVGGFVVASEYDAALFGWHDTIGPEAGFALMCGVACAVLGVVATAHRLKQRRPVP